ncbi:non-histone protein, partial [Coemansia sp. RSA 1694]
TLKPKAATSAEAPPSEEKHHKYRCRDLKRQLDELEEYNELLAIKLFRSQKRLRRMKIERNILLERFERTRHDPLHNRIDDSPSDSDSDAPLKDTFPRPAASDSEHAISAVTPTARGRRKGGAQHPKAVNNPPSSTASTPLLPPIDATTVHASSGRKSRSEKDPNAPKRPANAFVLYCQDERPSIKSAGTEMNSGELTRALAGTWKTLPKSERQKYFDLYEREMDRYHQEFAKYKIAQLATASRGGDDAAVATSAAISESSTVVVPSSFADTSSRDDDLDAMDLRALDENDEEDNRGSLNGNAAGTAKHFADDDNAAAVAAQLPAMSASAAGSLDRPESPHHLPPANGAHTPLSHSSASPAASSSSPPRTAHLASPTTAASDLALPSSSATVSGQL